MEVTMRYQKVRFYIEVAKQNNVKPKYLPSVEHGEPWTDTISL